MLLESIALALVLSTTPAGTNAPLATLNPVGFDFGEIRLGRVESSFMRVQNVFDSPIKVTTSITGDEAFVNDDTCNSLLDPGQTCLVAAIFLPPERTSFSATLRVNIADVEGQSSQRFDVPLVGAGTGGLLEIIPTTIDFGISAENASSRTTVTFLNTHSASVEFPGSQKLLSDFTALFACPNTLAPGQSCTADIIFSPSIAGPQETTIVQSVSAGSIEDEIIIAVRGTADDMISQDQLARVWPVAVDFGNIRPGTNVEVPITIDNQAYATLDEFSGGSVSSPFSYTTSCGSGVLMGGSCEYRYLFSATPETQGAEVTELEIVANNVGSQTVSIELSGRSVGRLAQVSPVAINFGSVMLGSNVVTDIVVTNTADDQLSNFLAVTSGNTFATELNTCAGDIATGATCSLQPDFRPSVLGAYSETVEIMFSNPNGLEDTVIVELTGTAVAGDDLIFANGMDAL